jgi:hypothetical protein
VGKLDTCEGKYFQKTSTAAPKLWSAVVHNRTGHNLAPVALLRKLRDGVLSSRHGMWPDSKVACCFIRQDVWALMKTMKLDADAIWYRDDGLRFDQYAEIPRLWIEDYEAHKKDYAKYKGSFEREQRFMKSEVLRGLHHQKLTDSFLLQSLVAGESELEDVRLALTGLAEVLFVQAMMDRLRRFWSPQSGCGSQDVFFQLHQDYLTGLQKIAADSDRPEDDDEEGDEEDSVATEAVQ